MTSRPTAIADKARRLLPASLLAAALAFAAIRFIWMQAVLARSDACGAAGPLLFLLLSSAIAIGPGLFAWRVARLSTTSIPLFASCVLAASLGCSMLVPWLLFMSGLWTRAAAAIFVSASAAMAIGTAASWFATPSRRAAARREIAYALRSLTISEALAIAFAFATAELLFELLAGHPMSGWDALLSWDQWAEETALADSLQRRALGFYPPGIPLIGSIFYKTMPPQCPVPVSSAHLLLHGFHAVFPLLLLLSICALSRPLGFNPLVAQLLTLSNFFIVQGMLKQTGDADIPLSAFLAASLAAAFCIRRDGGRSRQSLVAIPVFFAFAFTKGDGFAALAAAAIAAAIAKSPAWRPAALALLLALPFFVQQAVLSAFPSLIVHDPLRLALPLETIHSIFTPDFRHLVQWLAKAGPMLCLGDGAVSHAACAVAAILVASALAIPRARLLALAAMAWFTLWFFSASYDWRNAYPAHMLACIAASAALARAASAPRRHALRAALSCAFILASLALFSRQRIPGLMARLLRAPDSPRTIAMPAADRLAALSDLKSDYPLLVEAPFLRDAPHLLFSGCDYRLVPNGVRGLPYQGADTFAKPEAGDIAFPRRSFFAAKSSYEPVAGLSASRKFGDAACLYSPTRHEVPFSVERLADGQTLLRPSLGADSGFVELILDRPVPADFTVSPVRNGSAGSETAMDRVFAPWVDNCSIRLPFWFNGCAPEARAFRIATGGDARILSVRVLK